MKLSIKYLLLSSLLLASINNNTKAVNKDLINNYGEKAGYLNTTGKDPFFTMIDQAKSEGYVFQLGWIDNTGVSQHAKKAIELENLNVLRHSIYGFGGNYKFDRKFVGQRESYIGQAIEQIFFSDKKYDGKILVDEYKANVPMFWIIRDINDFDALKNYLQKNFTAENISTPTIKPVLVLKIDNDPELKTLTDQHKTFLNTYFEFFTTADQELKGFFEKNKETLINHIFDMGTSNPEMIKEEFLEGLARNTEGFWHKFKGKEMAIAAVAIITTKIMWDFISNEISDGEKTIVKRITGQSSLTSATINKLFPQK